METSGVIKLVITLPNGSQVSIESDDRELVREFYYSALPQLTGVLPADAEPAPAAPPEFVSQAKHDGVMGNGVNGRPHWDDAPVGTPDPEATAPAANGAEPTTVMPESPEAGTVRAEPNTHQVTGNGNGQPANIPDRNGAIQPITADELEYVAFCRRVSPLGDMRRVVVAAEAGDRYLSIKSVDPDELSPLFSLAGWPLPHNFVQTLRNAARTKFRWLERIAGQPGHYRVTNVGRSIVLGEKPVTVAARVEVGSAPGDVGDGA